MYGLNFLWSEPKVFSEKVSPVWWELNEAFVSALDWCWLVYAVGLTILGICTYFACSDRTQQGLELVHHRRVVERLQERPPQKRRPHAAYRDHQIFRNIILNLAKYMKNPDGMTLFFEQLAQLAEPADRNFDHLRVAQAVQTAISMVGYRSSSTSSTAL